MSVAAPNPCNLVSATEAAAITGQKVTATVEAPLGPTCIYRMGSKSQVTLTLESVSYSRISGKLSKRKELTVGGHASSCGSLGNQILFVPMSSSQVLSVSAPCDQAAQIAALAVRHLA